MKRRELEKTLKAAAQLAPGTEFFLIGSPAVHAYSRTPPAEVLLSQECDIYPRTRPELANLLHGRLGRGSPFARRNGFYLDVVTPEGCYAGPRLGNTAQTSANGARHGAVSGGP